VLRRRAPAGGFYADVDRAGAIFGVAVITIAFTLSFADSGERFPVQALMVGAVAAIFLSSVLFVNFLDHPYEDSSGSIKPTDMTRTLEIMILDQKASGGSVQVPCDAHGKAVASS